MAAAWTWLVVRSPRIARVHRHATEAGDTLPPGISLLVTRLFMLIWLGFLALPIVSVARAQPNSTRLGAAVAGIGVFAALYVGVVLLHRFDVSAPDTSRVCLALATTLAVLAVVLALAFGGDWLDLFIYVGCAAALALPMPAALWAVGGVALAAGVVSQLVDAGWVGTFVAVLPAGGLGLGMIGILHLFASIRELHVARRTAARLAVAEERLRIARDLHDLLGRSLSLIALKTELAGRLAASDPGAASNEIHDAERLAREALREVREVVAGYRQPMLRTELEDARDMLETAGIACTMTHMAGTLPPITDAVLAWAVREGATNVIRHSRAKRCTIAIVRAGDVVRCEICDDGRGAHDGACASGAPRGGSGLAGLAERVATGGGYLEAGPPHAGGGGFCLRIELPAGDERVSAHTVLAGGTGMGSGLHDSRVAR